MCTSKDLLSWNNTYFCDFHGASKKSYKCFILKFQMVKEFFTAKSLFTDSCLHSCQVIATHIQIESGCYVNRPRVSVTVFCSFLGKKLWKACLDQKHSFIRDWCANYKKLA